MVRVGISVEGATEERFIKMVLAPYLATKNIYMTPISVNGAINLDRIRSELQRMANSFSYVTTFYDFYGFQANTKEETKESLELKIKEHAHPSIQSKLIPYVQMYEFEGLLFTSPEAIAAHLQGDDLMSWAQQVLHSFDDNPEAINDSTETAPSKRLIHNTNYRKTTHGPNIALDIGVEELRRKCPGFDVWLNRLESLNENINN